jgi:hypothetical protein
VSVSALKTLVEFRLHAVISEAAISGVAGLACGSERYWEFLQISYLYSQI